MVTQRSKATPHPDVLSTTLQNGEAVLLHLGTNFYFSLNETGARIWDLMTKCCSLEEIGRAIEAEFDVTFDRAVQSVINLTEELEAEKIVVLSVP